MILTRSAVAFCVVLSLASCGVTYTPQTVSTKDTPLDVTVVSMSPSSIEVANRSSYTPRALPAEFFATSTTRQPFVFVCSALTLHSPLLVSV